MDSLINAAARALAAGDPIGALKRVALRNDAAALALRGIAMAQLGEHARARELLRNAARAFGSREAAARARCVLAEAEVALASRDLDWTARALDAAQATLARHGDHVNAAHARYVGIRRLLLIGKLDAVEQALAGMPSSLPPALQVTHELIVAHLAMRRVEAGRARAALLRATRMARQAGIPALLAEVEALHAALQAPAARLLAAGHERVLRLDEVEQVLASRALIVDDCRQVVRHGRHAVRLAKRPVLLALARTLAGSWPGDVARDALIAGAFRLRIADESHRARLRVEIGRLRRLLQSVAQIHATPRGFVLAPRGARQVVVLARPVEDRYAGVLALLADGESWSTSALAQALGTSQRTVQRALDALAVTRQVQPVGRGRARRWLATPLPGFVTPLLLPATLPGE